MQNKETNRTGENEKGQNAEYKCKDFKKEYYDLLKEDFRLISNLYDRWAKIPKTLSLMPLRKISSQNCLTHKKYF